MTYKAANARLLKRFGFVPSNHLPKSCEKTMHGWSNSKLLKWGPVRINTNHAEKMTETILMAKITDQVVYLTRMIIRDRISNTFLSPL